MRAASRIALASVAVVLLGGCGATKDKTSSEDAFHPFAAVHQQASAEKAALSHAALHWQQLATLNGSGAATKGFTVAASAVQWRARWRCQTGRLVLTAIAPSGSKGLTDARCPGRGMNISYAKGALKLGVRASGAWTVVLEQQVDSPIHEAPLAAMRARGARVVLTGRFYGVERFGRGKAELYRLPSGRLALRLAGGFATSPNTDLFVWLSTAPHPRNTVQAGRARHTVLAALKSTLGEQNYMLPRRFDTKRVRSIVIWCAPARIAYTAATLHGR